MSKADSMFEELGYEKRESDKYIKYIWHSKPKTYVRTLTFNKSAKKITPYNQVQINMNLLQAINEKCKELRMDIGELIKKITKIKKEEKELELEEYIKDLCKLKNKVSSAINDKGSDCFLIEGYYEKMITSKFFNKIENWGNTRYDKTYKVTITEQDLLKLEKELKKYNLNVY